MANDSTPNSNQSQFFMTVDACPWLDRKHTIFGKIEGPTFYNLLKISELETDKSTDRPVSDPIPMIKTVQVITNPIEDIVPRNLLQ
jgi:peptidyl-prolyl cis-trans isomerase SDCCAG10